MYDFPRVKHDAPDVISSLFKKRWIRRVAISLLSLFFLYVFAGFLGVPFILRYIVLAKINEKIVGTMEVDHFRFNPFSWELKIGGFVGSASKGPEVASFDELIINLDPSSVFGDSYVVSEIVWDHPRCDLHINESGELNLASVFGVKEGVPAAKESSPVVIPSLVVERLDVRDSALLLRIDNLDRPFKRELNNVSFTMTELKTNAGHDNPYQFSVVSAAGEALNIVGSFRLDPLSSVGSVSVKSLKLPDFSSFGSNLLGLEIWSGVLDLHFDYKFLPLVHEPELGIENGRLSLKDFSLNKAGSDQAYHRISSLSIDGLLFDVGRRSAGVNSINVDGVSIMLSRNEDGVLKWTPEVASQPSQVSSREQGAGKEETDEQVRIGLIAADKDIGEAITAALQRVHVLIRKSRQAGANAIDVTMQSFKLNDCALRISDATVQPSVNFEVRDVSLSAGPYVASGQRPLALQLSAVLGGDSTGGISLQGNLLPLSPFEASKFELSMDGVSMSSFGGYCVPVLGRALTGGAISVKVDCHMKNGLMESSNDLKITKIEFGPRVDGTGAPHLPLGLAVAVLEDPEGVISLDIPIKGDINHPEFSYRDAISYAVHNVITKIATAPMTALAAIFPHEDGSNPAAVKFDAGQSSLPEGADSMLMHLVKIMKSRPGLVIELTPSYAAEDDATALAELRFEEGIIEFTREGGDRIAAIKKMHKRLPKAERAPGIFPEHENMELAVRKSYQVRKGELSDLAVARVNAVQSLLAAQGGIKLSRVKIKAATRSDSRQLKIRFDADIKD